MTITSQPQHVCICAPLWTAQLQQAPICANWNGGTRPRQTSQVTNICRTLQKGVCPRHIHQALSMLEVLVKQHTGNPRVGSSILQTQIYHQPSSNSGGPSHSSGGRSIESFGNKHAAPSMTIINPSTCGPTGRFQSRCQQVRRQPNYASHPQSKHPHSTTKTAT